jgi:membrane protease YdiL (CAAX protease family)
VVLEVELETERRERRIWAIAEPLLALAGAFALTLALVSPFIAVGDAGAAASGDLGRLMARNPGLLPLAMSIQAGVFVLIGILLARRRLSGPVFERRGGIGRAAWVGLVAGLVALVGGIVVGLGLQLAGLPVKEQDWVLELLGERTALIWAVPWIVVIGPVAEEVFFRGYVLRAISEGWGFGAGAWISSLMFAAIHMNLSGFFVYLVIGLVLSRAYARTGTIVTPIVAHVTNNAIVLLLARIAATAGA